jgi:16S rRNA (adenine1518-N6/adenine1519-N6)-dimethyltransferase
LSKHKARKRFGQNFLTDNRVIERIVATIAPKFNDNLLEIGPGQGAMTLPLYAHKFLNHFQPPFFLRLLFVA